MTSQQAPACDRDKANTYAVFGAGAGGTRMTREMPRQSRRSAFSSYAPTGSLKRQELFRAALPRLSLSHISHAHVSVATRRGPVIDDTTTRPPIRRDYFRAAGGSSPSRLPHSLQQRHMRPRQFRRATAGAMFVTDAFQCRDARSAQPRP